MGVYGYKTITPEYRQMIQTEVCLFLLKCLRDLLRDCRTSCMDNLDVTGGALLDAADLLWGNIAGDERELEIKKDRKIA